jgi:hypothetical protein
LKWLVHGAFGDVNQRQKDGASVNEVVVSCYYSWVCVVGASSEEKDFTCIDNMFLMIVLAPDNEGFEKVSMGGVTDNISFFVEYFIALGINPTDLKLEWWYTIPGKGKVCFAFWSSLCLALLGWGTATKVAWSW